MTSRLYARINALVSENRRLKEENERLRGVQETTLRTTKELVRSAIGAAALIDAQPVPQNGRYIGGHVCGLQGFGRGVGAANDRCPACEASNQRNWLDEMRAEQSIGATRDL